MYKTLTIAFAILGSVLTAVCLIPTGLLLLVERVFFGRQFYSDTSAHIDNAFKWVASLRKDLGDN